jgi:hypothetical protein
MHPDLERPQRDPGARSNGAEATVKDSRTGRVLCLELARHRRPWRSGVVRASATVVDLAAYRARVTRSRGEIPSNEVWDTLVELANQAWSWRDPESIAALEACVEVLAAEAATDWNEGS